MKIISLITTKGRKSRNRYHPDEPTAHGVHLGFSIEQSVEEMPPTHSQTPPGSLLNFCFLKRVNVVYILIVAHQLPPVVHG
jgi:hypothetical protein